MDNVQVMGDIKRVVRFPEYHIHFDIVVQMPLFMQLFQ